MGNLKNKSTLNTRRIQLSENADYVCKLKKLLYGLKQVPRAWYSRLDKYLQQIGFRKGSAEINLYIKIHQSNQGIFISQTKCIKEMLKRFRMEDCKTVITPMHTSCKLSKDDDSKSTDQRQYMSMIGSLLYVTTSRSYVMQEVGQVARFQEAPKESHVLVVKRIFRYLKGIQEFGLWYPKGNDLSLIAYIDADWAGYIDDR